MQRVAEPSGVPVRLKRSRRLLSPIIVGRDVELEALRGLVAKPPAVAIVEGEAGVGKTRLLTELLELPELATRLQLVGRCPELRQPFPLGPVIDALRGLQRLPSVRLTPIAGALRRLLPELADHLPPELPSLGDRRADRHVLFRAVVELLSSLGSAILVLEDLHWIDENTAEFLRYLVARMPRDLSLVLTWRPEDLPSGSPLATFGSAAGVAAASAVLSLLPLTAPEVRRVVGAILSTDDVSEEFAARVHERTSGLPFAVEEVVGLVQERGDLLHRGDRWVRRELDALEVPRAVQLSVLERVSRLDPEARRLVEAAAVLQDPSPQELLAGVAEVELADIVSALSQAISRAVLFRMSVDRYGLRHSLAAQAVRTAIPAPRRQRYHLKAALALEAGSPGDLGRMTHHFREAARHAEAVRYAEAAADHAAALGDDAAASHFLRAAIATPQLDAATRYRLASKFGAAALRGFTLYEEAASALSLVLEDTSLRDDDRGHARNLLAALLRSTGESSRAYLEATRAVDELHSRPAEALDAMLHLASPWFVDGRLDEHLRWLGRAQELAATDATEPQRLEVLNATAVTLLEIGDPRGWAAAREALDAIGEADERVLSDVDRAWAVQHIAGACFHAGRYGDAERLLREARDLAGTPDPSLQIGLATPALLLAFATGHWDGLEARAREHSDLYAEIPWARTPALIVTGSLALACGDHAGALRHLGFALHTERECGLLPGIGATAAALARVRLENGDAASAVAEAQSAIELFNAKGVWAWAAPTVAVAVDGLVALSRLGEAADLTRRFAVEVECIDAPLARAHLTVAQGTVAEARADLEAASRAYEAGAAAFDALPCPYEASRARGRLALSKLDNGDAAAARGGLDTLAALDGMGATADGARLRRALRERGVRAPVVGRRGRRGYGQSLSPREHQVAELAAQGRTNAEIARALFLSQPTTAHHLAAAMRKLNVSKRGALGRRLAELENS